MDKCRIARFFATVLLSLWVSSSNAAEVFYWSGADREPMSPMDYGPDGIWSSGAINIVGAIEVGDLDRIIEILRDHSQMPGFAISSPGGEVSEAMRIGRFLRGSMLDITVLDNAECFSACFLVVVGATGRYVNAPIGIHRAYFDPEYFGNLSPLDAEARYGELDSFVRQYLYEMDVAENVIAEMMATKSTDGRYLSPDEIRSRVGQFSPAIEEWLIARCGELSDEELHQVYSILIYTGLHDLQNDELIRFADEIKLAASLSAEYRAELLEQTIGVNRCTRAATRKHHEAVLTAIKKRD